MGARAQAEAEADPALPRCAAFWLELTRTLAGLGLVAINAPPSTAGASATLSEVAAPPDDLIVITSAGQQELALLCSHAQPPGDGTASAAPGKSTEARAVTRNMRCSGPLLQAEAAAVASSSGAMDAIIANVRFGCRVPLHSPQQSLASTLLATTFSMQAILSACKRIAVDSKLWDEALPEPHGLPSFAGCAGQDQPARALRPPRHTRLAAPAARPARAATVRAQPAAGRGPCGGRSCAAQGGPPLLGGVGAAGAAPRGRRRDVGGGGGIGGGGGGEAAVGGERRTNQRKDEERRATCGTGGAGALHRC